MSDGFVTALQAQAREEMKVIGAKLSQLTLPVLQAAAGMVTELLFLRLVEKLLRDGQATQENLDELFSQLDNHRAAIAAAAVKKEQ